MGSGGHTTSEADEAELPEISTMFATDRRFKLESQIFNLSLCVTPSDYLYSVRRTLRYQQHQHQLLLLLLLLLLLQLQLRVIRWRRMKL
jgi:hypothetical protein